MDMLDAKTIDTKASPLNRKQKQENLCQEYIIDGSAS
jgi:hypothetical protein